MMRILDCTDEYLISEFDHFFENTWNRHGNGSWIRVSIYNLDIRDKKVGKLTCQEFEDELDLASLKSQGIYQKSDNQLEELKDASVVSHTRSSRTDDMLSCDRKHTSSKKKALTDKNKSPLCSSSHAMHHHFASDCCSSPESAVQSKTASSGKRSFKVEKDSVDPTVAIIKDSNVMKPTTSCKYIPASDSTLKCSLSSSALKPTQLDDVHDPSTVSMDIFRHENISHVEDSHYFLNHFYDILYGDFESYWKNLLYGRYCENGRLEELFYHPPPILHSIDFRAPFYWSWRPSGSENVVPPTVPRMPPPFTSDLHSNINQCIPYSLPIFSGGIGTFMPNPFAYHEVNIFHPSFTCKCSISIKHNIFLMFKFYAEISQLHI